MNCGGKIEISAKSVFLYPMKNGFLFILTMALAFSACRETPQTDVWNLTAPAPAQIWEECYPLGNGHLGMMPDGGIEKETIVLNDITLWSGAPSNDSNPLAL